MISFGSCIYPTLGSVKVSPSRVASPENNQHQTLKVSGVTPRPELPPITLQYASALGIITRCAYAQGRVKRLSPSICLSSKNTAVCCLTARKSPRNSSLPLGLAIYILRKMPRKPDESSVECYGHGFLIAARPRGV